MRPLLPRGIVALQMILVLALTMAAIGHRSEARAAVTTPSSEGWLAIPIPAQRPVVDEQLLVEGRRLYDYRCSPCHGVKGDAQGPVAPYLDPRPRDLTQANYKVRTTSFGELPLDEDLYRTITRGIPGTAMPSWATLGERERWALVAYSKTFSDLFEDEAFDPLRVEDGESFVASIPEPPPITDDLLARGREVFLRGSCVDCHGTWGRGDGTSAGTQYSYMKQRILPRDLSKSWRYKGGSDARDLFRTLTTGWNGTPMPSFVGSLDKDDPAQDEADRWAVALWVRSQMETLEPMPPSRLRVPRVQGPLPATAGDAAWGQAAGLRLPMFGQVIRAPRWQIPAIDQVELLVLHDEAEIAFRLRWNDRTESREHTSAEPAAGSDTFPLLDVSEYAHKVTRFADQIALQFPASSSEGPERPYLLYGQMDRPVVQWHFRADRGAGEALEERFARGPGRLKAPGDEGAPLSGEASYEAGQWSLVVRRSLSSPRPNDVHFDDEGSTPFVVMAWDGGHGEGGLRHSLSAWYELELERPTSFRAWLHGLLALLFVGLLEGVWWFRIRRRTP